MEKFFYFVEMAENRQNSPEMEAEKMKKNHFFLKKTIENRWALCYNKAYQSNILPARQTEGPCCPATQTDILHEESVI